MDMTIDDTGNDGCAFEVNMFGIRANLGQRPQRRDPPVLDSKGFRSRAVIIGTVHGHDIGIMKDARVGRWNIQAAAG